MAIPDFDWDWGGGEGEHLLPQIVKKASNSTLFCRKIVQCFEFSSSLFNVNVVPMTEFEQCTSLVPPRNGGKETPMTRQEHEPFLPLVLSRVNWNLS